MRGSYTLRYTPYHLAEAADGTEPLRREELIQSVVSVTSNPSYAGRLEDDLPTLHEHCGRAVAAAARSESDAMLPGLCVPPATSSRSATDS